MPELSRLAFVAAETSHACEDEILRLVAHEVALLGIEPIVTPSALDDDEKTVFVFAPRDDRAGGGAGLIPKPGQLGRSIALCLALPGQASFPTSARLAGAAGFAFHISLDGVRDLRVEGVQAERFRVGYSGYWDRWRRDESVARTIDVLHLDDETPRRLTGLASCAPALWPHRTLIHVPPGTDPRPRPDRPVSTERWDLLRSAAVVLQMRSHDGAPLAWLMVAEAICNGCVVVTEPSPDCAPLVAGRHFLAGELVDLGSLADRVARDPELARELRLGAYDVLRQEAPTRSSAERLVAMAAHLAGGQGRGGPRPSSKRVARSARPSLPRLRRLAAPIETRVRARVGDAARERRRRARLKAMTLNQLELTRRVRELELRSNGVDPTMIDEIARTPAYASASPSVSVIVPLYDHESEVEATLASVAASDHTSFDVVVLDDASTDGSRETVSSLLDREPRLPAVLLAHRVNRGVGRTRTDLVHAARGALVFVLDADNEIYPTALTRLEAALDADADAAFAYSTLEVHAEGAPIGLVSHQPWEPRRLRLGNYIDAMAMIRRQTLVELGGYTDDVRLHGWEDYDLWCRMAERGFRGVHVPQILGRYRRAEASMLSVTNLDMSEAERLLRASYPLLMGGRGGGSHDR